MSGGLALAGEPDATALESAAGRWSVARLAAEADAVADRLLDAWHGDGRPCVAHRFATIPAAVVAIHAIARAGARLAVAHPGWDADQTAAFDAAVAPDLWMTAEGIRRGAPPGSRPEPPPGSDVLLATSGTSGASRFVCHSWDGLLANATAAARRNRFGPGDAWLPTLAWAHVGGLAVVVRAAAAGARIAFGPPRFEPDATLDAIQRFGVTHVSLVPAMLHALLELGRAVPPTLRCVLVGGAATPPGLARRAVEAGWPVALTYGLTEMGSQVATGDPGGVATDAGVRASGPPASDTAAPPPSVGRPLDGIEVRIGSGEEIEVRGTSRALGVLGERWDPDGWLSTGDLGALDGDGRLRVTGRRADRIVTGGTNVDPVEVEAVLAAHPAVREVCVVGTPDPVWGEIVTAVAVVEPAAAAGSSAEAPGLDPGGALDAWVACRLTGARRPRRWWWVDALPRTASGKVDRACIRRRAAARFKGEGEGG